MNEYLNTYTYDTNTTGSRITINPESITSVRTSNAWSIGSNDWNVTDIKFATESYVEERLKKYAEKIYDILKSLRDMPSKEEWLALLEEEN